MKLKLYRNLFLEKTHQLDTGFSLIETVIALTTLGVCLAYAMPLFLYAKINNSKSEIRTGALIVSQRVFDSIRAQPMSSLPLNDGLNSPSSGVNPILQPVTMPPTLGSQEQILTYAMGRQYQTKITYCGNVNVTPTNCSNQYRQFQVEVSYNGTKVYDLQGTYTQFQ
jgi:Tfp pilus assembly protein PilV